jgi:hypothetical protein
VDEVTEKGKKASRSSSCHGGDAITSDDIGGGGVIVLLLKVMLGRVGSAEPVTEACKVVKVGDDDGLSNLQKLQRKEPVDTSILQGR